METYGKTAVLPVRAATAALGKYPRAATAALRFICILE